MHAISFLSCRIKGSAPKAWCILGKYYQGQHKLKDSLSPLKQCSTLDPSAENRLSYSIALFDYGNFNASKEMFHLAFFLTLSLSSIYNEDPSNKKAAYYYGLPLAWVSSFAFID